MKKSLGVLLGVLSCCVILAGWNQAVQAASAPAAAIVKPVFKLKKDAFKPIQLHVGLCSCFPTFLDISCSGEWSDPAATYDNQQRGIARVHGVIFENVDAASCIMGDNILPAQRLDNCESSTNDVSCQRYCEEQVPADARAGLVAELQGCVDFWQNSCVGEIQVGFTTSGGNRAGVNNADPANPNTWFFVSSFCNAPGIPW